MKEKKMINIDKIKPKIKGKSDFFSWQLYRWLKKHPERYEIYKGNGLLYIGRMDDSGYLFGNSLNTICRYNQKLSSYAFPPDFYNWEDKTDEFWKEYMSKGVCAIHDNLAHDFIYNDDKSIRTCEYCKKVEYKKIIMIPKEIWVNNG